MPTLKIVQDRYPSNPRDDDNVCLMVCKHRNYALGDKDSKQKLATMLDVYSDDYSIQELVAMAHERDLVLLSKPLYLYDHGGITMSTSEFSCQFDSGQVGVIIAFKEKIKDELSVKRMGKKVKEKMLDFANKHIDAEVKVYDQYISGDVYLLQEVDSKGHVTDVLGSFFGSDVKTNGMLDYVYEEKKEELLNLSISYS